MPALNSPEAIQGVEFYANLLKNYAPKGVLTYTEDQARQALLTGRSNIFIHSSAWVTPILLSDESKVKDTSRVVRMPAGPVRDFPAANSQGLGIPKNAKNKKAAWEFIKWALSPEISMRLVKEHGHSSVCRRSVIRATSIASSTRSTARTSARSISRCWSCRPRARTTWPIAPSKEFPIVGDVLNKAFEQVATGPAAGAGRDERRAGAGGRQHAPGRDRALSGKGLVEPERRRFNAVALAPSLIVLFVIAGLPAIYLVVTSLTPFQLVNPGSVDRFQFALAQLSPAAWRPALRQFAVGAGQAVVLRACCSRCCSACCWRCCCTRQSRVVEFARTFFLIPMVLPPIVVAVIWKLIYTPDISPLYYAAQPAATSRCRR